MNLKSIEKENEFQTNAMMMNLDLSLKIKWLKHYFISKKSHKQVIV